MIGRSIGLLLVVGSGLALVACGGKAKGVGFSGGAGNGGTNDPTGGNTPPGGYQTPPPTYETPPPTYETPPPDYDNPGGGTEACTQICNALVNRTCGGQVITAEAMAACPGECRTLITEYAPCGTQYGALLSCMFRTQFFQDLLDAACAGEEFEVDEADAEEFLAQCGQQLQAFEDCSGSISEPPPGQVCNIEGDQCAGCIGSCEMCECTQGPAACVDICNPPV
jgi:hypothetical protein